MSKKISQLTAITASNVQQTSVLPMSQGAETYKIAISDLKTLVSPTSSIQFTATDTTSSIAELRWDGEGLSIGMVGGNVDLQIGREELVRVRNVDSTQINNGDVVYIFGATGERPSVKKASNIGDPTSSKVLGMATENISVNGTGFVTTHGLVNGINLQGFNEGDILWLSNTPGQITKVKPVSPEHLVFIGVALRANANGIAYVNPQNGYELSELHDVESYNSNNLGENWQLYWSKQTQLWQTRSFGEILIKSITSSYTVNMDNDYCLLVEGAVPIEIESLREGKTLIIKNNHDKESCVVNVSTSVENYDKVIIPAKGAITLLCDGNEWKIINRCFLNSQIKFTAQTTYTVDLLNDDVIFCDDLSSVTINSVQQGKKLTFVNLSKAGSCQIDASIAGGSFYVLAPGEKITIIGETINIVEWIIIA